MASPKSPPTIQHIKKACAVIGACLADTTYAIIGGAACSVLGSARTTDDVDVVVLKGTTSGARQLLAASKHIVIDTRTRHTHYTSEPGGPPVQIELLAPPGFFREKFDENTPTMEIEIEGQVVKILHPIALLNAKCASILQRASVERKTSDAKDIGFLLGYLASHDMIPAAGEVPNATKEVVEYLAETYGGEELWTGIGFDFEKGDWETKQ